MTYQQKFEELRKEFAEKSDMHIKALSELNTTNGFGNMDALGNFAKSKHEFEVSGNSYHSFISFVQKNNISPEAEIG